jgi:DNA-binding beta-propeller fold protein YncE
MDRRAFLSLAGASLAGADFELKPVPAEPGLIYVGAFGSVMLVLDEATEKVVSTIPLSTGIARGLRLSHDKKRLYVFTTLSGIEVIDLKSRKVVNAFKLDSGNRRIRTRGSWAEDPNGKFLYSMSTASMKQIDRFEIEKPKFTVVDLEQKKIVRTVDLPAEEAARLGWGANLRTSPDGKFLYAFSNNVLIFDTTDFKLVEKIDLSQPPQPWMATINMNFRDDPHQEAGILTGIFSSTDPVVRRNIFGIGRFDLNKRTYDFSPVGPASAGVGQLQVTPDRKLGYTVVFQGDVGNRRVEFWVFDMPTRKVTRRVEFDGPVNFSFTLSGNGKLIYVHGAAPVMELYDVTTLTVRKTIDVNADLTTGLMVLPRSIA